MCHRLYIAPPVTPLTWPGGRPPEGCPSPIKPSKVSKRPPPAITEASKGPTQSVQGRDTEAQGFYYTSQGFRSLAVMNSTIASKTTLDIQVLITPFVTVFLLGYSIEEKTTNTNDGYNFGPREQNTNITIFIYLIIFKQTGNGEL